MQYVTETSLMNFKAWAGGKVRLDGILEHCQKTGDWSAYDYLEEFINEWGDCGETPRDVDINDFLWFSSNEMLREAGYVDEDGNWKDENDD